MIKEEMKNGDGTDTSQVLDLSTNNTPTTPPPELEHPSDAFGLLAAIKEEERQNFISPEKFRSRGAQIKEEPPNFGGSDNSFLTNSPPAEENLAGNGLDTPKTRSRDELKSFIRACKYRLLLTLDLELFSSNPLQYCQTSILQFKLNFRRFYHIFEWLLNNSAELIHYKETYM